MMCSEDPIQFPSPLSPATFDSFWLPNDHDFFLPNICEIDNSSSPDNHHHPSLLNHTSSSSPEPYSHSPPVFSFGSGSDSHDHHHHELQQMMSEKRQRRKLSNRESARRSRQRKKQHLEILDSELTRLTDQNREYKNRLRVTLHYLHVTKHENHRLRVESVLLQNRLTELNRARAVKINLMRITRQQQQQPQHVLFQHQQGLGLLHEEDDYSRIIHHETINKGINSMTTTDINSGLVHLSTNIDPYSMVI